MQTPDWTGPLTEAYRQAIDYLTGVPGRRIGAAATLSELRAALGGPLPEAGGEASQVIAELATAVEPGLVASGSGRFHGFVIGGVTPVALGADWLTATWDQNAGLYVAGPAAAVVEDVTADWLAQLLGVPAGASAGFVTGGQMANFTALAAARNHVLRGVDWDVEQAGLIGAPSVRVFAGVERHDTIDRALRFLGLGKDALTAVDADDQGRMRPAALRDALREAGGPTIVCAQAGNVNSGAIDPLGEICEIAHQAQAWVHVDGAFGLWAAASPRYRPLLAGVEMADSWAADAHKWLNVPYDSGVVFCAHPDAHRAAMGVRASYLSVGDDGERDELDYNPELSRRARAFPIYAAIRALGRAGISDLVERSCALTHRFADQLGARSDVEVLNEVVLNQLLVRFRASDGDHDRYTREVVRQIQRDGTCWMSGTTWHGTAAMRISVINWSTDERDVDTSVDAIVRCLSRGSADEPTPEVAGRAAHWYRVPDALVGDRREASDTGH